MALRKIREAALPLPTSDADGVLIGEAVREAGLNPKHFLAVVPAECARGGRVNINDRIYDPAELTAEHERLSEAAKVEFVPGMLEHEVDGPTWDVPVRFLGGETVTESDGSVVARGRFGITNTTAGRDVLTLWEAGFPIGVSSDALGRKDPHVLNESSPFYAMNEGAAGRKVTRVSKLRLRKYDVVRISSADTHFDPPSTAVREALERLTESKILPDEGDDADDTGPVTEGTMDPITTLAALRAAYPNLVGELEQGVRESANPFKGMSDEQRSMAVRIAEAVQKKPDAASEPDWAKAIREQADVDRARLADLEGERTTLLESVTTQGKELTETRAELKREKTRTAVRESLDVFAKGRRGGNLIVEHVLARFDAGQVTDVPGATALADDTFKLGESLAKLAEVPAGTGTVVGTVTEGATGTGTEVKVTESRDSGLNPGDRPGAQAAAPRNPLMDLIMGGGAVPNANANAKPN